jgi:hypothetical protein
VQAAQIAFEPNGVRIEIRLTPGVQVAERIFGIIDVNHDGSVSQDEQQAYAQRVMRDLLLEVDGKPASVTLRDFEFPSYAEMKRGADAIHLNLWTGAPLTTTDEHQLVFRNDHLPKFSTYFGERSQVARRSIRDHQPATRSAAA